MGVPVNFDSVGLDGILSDWVCALREFSVEAVVVLGPDPFGTPEDRQVRAVHPPLIAMPRWHWHKAGTSVRPGVNPMRRWWPGSTLPNRIT